MMDTILQDLKRNLERSDRNVELLQDQFETFQDRMVRRIDEGLRENRNPSAVLHCHLLGFDGVDQPHLWV